jgi:autotransporter adhesin
MAKKLNLTILQGDTFSRVIRWESPPFIYKAVTGITNAAPAVVTAIAHGLKTGWRAVLVSVKGMKQINAANDPPRDSDFGQVTVPDVDHVSFNKINSSDYSIYTSGGYLQFYTPVDMTGYSARMTIKDRVGGTILQALVSPTDIVIDNVNHTITITISAATTAGWTWTTGTYDLEMVSPTAVVTKLYKGSISVTKEVTT